MSFQNKINFCAFIKFRFLGYNSLANKGIINIYDAFFHYCLQRRINEEGDIDRILTYIGFINTEKMDE